MTFFRSSYQLFTTAVLFFYCLANVSESFAQKVPVIGIMSTPRSNRTFDKSFIKTGNPEFIESGGSITIPIPWDLPEEKFKALLNSVNGVFFTGGTALLWNQDPTTGERSLNAFSQRLKYVVDLVIEKKKQGINFPLLAICQGMEATSLIMTGDMYILDNFTHFGKLGKINFTSLANKSTIFQHFTNETFDYLEYNPTMYFYHQYGLNTSVPSLYPVFGSDKFKILAYSKDDKGQKFISAMESKEYPIFLLMFHSERILYEFNHVPNSNHSPIAAGAAKLIAKSLATEASKNPHQFENNLLLNALTMENFPVNDLGELGLYYVFTPNSLDEKWNAAYTTETGKKTWIIWVAVVVAVIAVAGFFGYRHYKKKSSKNAAENVKLIELRSPHVVV